MQTASTGTQAVQRSQYDVWLHIPGPTVNAAPLVFDPIPIVALEDLATQGFHALIGRDILGLCVFHYNGDIGYFTIAY